MKYIFLTFALTAAFVVDITSQTPPADSDPVLQNATTYKMPQSAIDAEIDGKVTVAMSIDKSGKPTKANVVSGLVWPCSSTPTKALEDLIANLSQEMLKLSFSPAVKNGKPVDSEISLSFELKNPKLAPKPAEIDPVTGKPKAKMINAGIVNGKAKYLPKPSYPDLARSHRDSGYVSVQVIIDEQGIVIRAGAIDGSLELQSPSRVAACNAKFSPTFITTGPLKVLGILRYAFIRP